MAQVTKVTINEEECISCEACVAEAPEVFEMVGDKAKVRQEANNPAALKEHSEKILAAVAACPNSSISCETA